MMTRGETKILIARQIAIFNGQSWERLSPERKNATLTLAENILATVERNQMAFKWDSPQDRARRQAAINDAAELP